MKENRKNDNTDQALACFQEGFNCAQALLSTYGARFGLDREIALRIAGAFGGGMGNMGETCGAVTGAFMVIGLKLGKTKGNDDAARERTDNMVREFASRFRAKNKSLICRDLLDCDISTSAGLKTAKKEKHFKKRCPRLVQDAAEIIEQIV